MKLTAKSCSVVLGLLLGGAGAQAQECVEAERRADFQAVLPNGDLVLLATRLDGRLMETDNDDKFFRVNSIRLNARGKLLSDTLVLVRWPERYYNRFDCQASYGSNEDLSRYGVDSTSDGRCATYVPLLAPANALVAGYYLLNDPAFAYELRIDARGRVQSAVLDLKKRQPYRTGQAKFQLVASYVEQRHKGVSRPPAPDFVVEDARSIRLAAHPQVRLLPDPQDSLPARRLRWRVQGPGWTLPLPGSVSMAAPGLSVSGNLLYVTVQRTAPCHCPPLNDSWPVVSCIDLTTGTLRWQYEALPTPYGCHD